MGAKERLARGRYGEKKTLAQEKAESRTKAKTTATKKRGVATTEAVKKMKQKEETKRSAPPKPRAKPARASKEDPKPSNARKARVKADTTKNPPSTAAGGGPRKRKSGPVSGATRGTSGKIDNSVGAKFKRGMKRLFGTEKARKTTGPGPEKFDRTSAGGKKVNELSLKKNKYKSRKQARTGR